MNLKSFRIGAVIALSMAAFSASAQDKIYLMDGSTVEAKVKEVGPRNIIYTRWDNKEGAEYVVVRRDVSRIVFQNGTEEIFTRGGLRRPEGPRAASEPRDRTPIPGYGRNILSIAPIQMTNESAAGIGVHYERVMDKNGIFSLYLPIAVAFYEDQNYLGSGPVINESRVFTYIYPGAKIYPAGSAHRVSYSVGPTFAFGFGEKWKESRIVDPSTGSIIRTFQEGSVFKTGFMIHNGLNMQPTKALYLGLELGVGIMYYDNEYEDFSAGNEPLVQFNFKMGYRF